MSKKAPPTPTIGGLPAPGLRALAQRVDVSREPLPNTLWTYRLECACGEAKTRQSDSHFVGTNQGIPFYNDGWRVIGEDVHCPRCVGRGNEPRDLDGPPTYGLPGNVTGKTDLVLSDGAQSPSGPSGRRNPMPIEFTSAFCGLCCRVVNNGPHPCVCDDGSGRPEEHLPECTACGTFHGYDPDRCKTAIGPSDKKRQRAWRAERDDDFGAAEAELAEAQEQLKVWVRKCADLNEVVGMLLHTPAGVEIEASIDWLLLKGPRRQDGRPREPGYSNIIAWIDQTGRIREFWKNADIEVRKFLDSETKGKIMTFWYYHEVDYPEEGYVFPFATEAEAKEHARQRAEDDPTEMTFGQREATEDEQAMIDFGRGQ